ncbi:MAG TPA: adenylate/guanylate cyclase domain-containing protein [Dehalococcoidia bacterium]|nr:adenylate/guanylate cyclase domain-containing protein [Dehalococcoidia bacterium]
MRPQVRYVKSSDGTRLAVSTLGQGQPLVLCNSPMGTIGIEGLWEMPEIRRNLERLAETRKVILYDSRGVGLSTRDVEDYSADALERDLEAVVGSLDVPAADLMASIFAGPSAINFAACHQDRVRKLILTSAIWRGRDFHPPRELRHVRGLVESNWKTYLEVQSLIVFGWTDAGRHWAERLSADLSKDAILKGFAEFRASDATEQLVRVHCPTLIMHLRDDSVSMEIAREITEAISNARLLTRSRSSFPTWLGDDWDSVFAPAIAFLDEDPEPAEAQLPSGTAIILFADIVDSTALTESLGDAAFRDRARDLDAALRATIREHSGTPIEGKLLGDGVLAVFTSARQAIEAAVACGNAGDEGGLPLHLGLHAGDVIREDNNVYGGAVNIASRISGLSTPGEVLVSETVRSLARTSAGPSVEGFEDRGEQALKGIGETVRVWAVRTGEA